MALTKSLKEIISEDRTGLLSTHPTWERVCLREVASVLNGFPFESRFFHVSEGTPLIRIRDVLSGATDTFYNGEYEEQFLVHSGDLLVGMDGDFNSARWRSTPGLLNQRVCKLTNNEAFYSGRLLELALPGYLAAINASTSSVTVKHLSSRSIEDIELPLPPRAEQERIVEKLEELLSDLDAGVAELKAAQKKLARYRQSLLKAAVEGALTAQWRQSPAARNVESGADLLQRILRERRSRWEARQLAKFKEQGKAPPKDWQAKYPEPVAPDTTDLPALPKGWVWASLDMLGEIVSGVAKGMKRGTNAAMREVPYLRVANVQRGYLDLSEVKTILATESDIADLTLRSGDVLFNEGGDRDKLGRGWVWRDEVKNCIHQNHVFRFRPFLPETVPELISHHGNSFGRQWFESVGKQTTNLASINMGILRSFPVPVAPATEQRVILDDLVQRLDAFSDQERAVELGLRQSVAQRKNILQAAFSGQLVPQNPADEPAGVLLERIRTERAQRVATTPSRRKIKKPA